MGGTNEKSIQNLRFHVSGDEVHIHDDTSKKKFYCKKDFFKKEMIESLEALKDADGIAKINGCSRSDNLYIMREDSRLFIFIGWTENYIESLINDFLKNC